MSIKARNAHFTNWAKVVAALSSHGVTDESTARAFLANSENNDFYYMVSYIKDTKEIYTHGQFYSCSEYDDTELRNLISDLTAEVAENEFVAATALTALEDNKADKTEIPDVSGFVSASDLHQVATSGSYNDLTDLPTLPDAITEETVTNWGFTKNTGTYVKPDAGIPSSDLSSSVRASLNKADTALQSYTETDPVFSASVASDITTNDLTNWNSKISGIKMNGQNIAADTDMIVDLGNVAGDIYTYDYGQGLPIYGSAEVSGTMTLEEYENLAKASVWRVHAEEGSGWIQLDLINNDSPETALAAMKIFGTSQILWMIFKGETEASWSWTVSNMVSSYIETTHSNLVGLIDSNSLVPGTRYRITDYVATTASANTQTANHPFDIVVTAISTNELDEHATAMPHEGDDYFANSDLSKWDIKYDIDGDSTKFGWAKGAARDAMWKTSWGPLVSTGTATIDGTTMYLYESSTDPERNYLSNYSFYWNRTLETITSADQLVFIADSPLEFTSYGEGSDGSTDGYWSGPSEITVQTISGNYLCTLYSDYDNNYCDEGFTACMQFTTEYTMQGDKYILTPEDATQWFSDMFGDSAAVTEKVNYTGEVSTLYYGFTSQLTSGTQPSIKVVDSNTARVYFSEDWSDRITYSPAISEADAGKGVIYYMKDEFGNECPYDFKGLMFKHPNNPSTYAGYYYTFSSADSKDLTVTTTTCIGNKIGCYVSGGKQQFNKNLFIGGIPVGNEVGLNSYNNTFGSDAQYNTIGSNCYSNQFGNSCVGNILDTDNNTITFGDTCEYNHLHRNGVSNKFGNACKRNILHMYCRNNTFGNTCNTNRLYNYCSNNTFGNNCVANILNEACNYNSFRMSASTSGVIRNYCNRNVLDGNCSYNIIYNATTASSTQAIEYVHIHSGVTGTASNYNMIAIDTLKPSYTIEVAKNSSGEIKQYCVADLIA